MLNDILRIELLVPGTGTQHGLGHRQVIDMYGFSGEPNPSVSQPVSQNVSRLLSASRAESLTVTRSTLPQG